MDKTNYLLDKVSQIESELQLQAQINQDTQEKIDTNDKNITSLQDKTSTLDTKVATLQDDISTCSTSIDKKVDKVDGKDLSTNDFTTDYKNQIDTNKTNITNKANCDASNLDDTNIQSWANKCQFERLELFYDYSSSDSNLNWGKTSGIGAGNYTNATKESECLSKYKKLYIHYQWGDYNPDEVCILPLDKQTPWGSYATTHVSASIYEYSTDKKFYNRNFFCLVGEGKFEFHFGADDYTTNYDYNTTCFVRQIWGVLK